MNRSIPLAAAILAGCTALALPAMAAPTDIGNGGLSVSLEVSAGCTVNTSAVSFTASGKITTAVNEASAGSVTVTCTDGISYEIGLDEGLYAGSDQTTVPTGSDTDTTHRRLYNSSAATYKYVSYDLYSNAGRTTHWGNTPATDAVAGSGVGGSPVSVYGKIPATQNASVGSYVDTVTATVWYDPA